MIEIDGLNEYQIKLLNLMWTMKTAEEYQRFKSMLTEQMMNDVDTLEQLVILASLDEEIGDNVEDATEVLSKFVL